MTKFVTVDKLDNPEIKVGFYLEEDSSGNIDLVAKDSEGNTKTILSIMEHGGVLRFKWVGDLARRWGISLDSERKIKIS